MSNPRVTGDLSLIESLSKLFAISLGFLYLLGFLVVSFYLSRYGVSSFSVLQLQYLIAGIWVLGPGVVAASLVYASHRFDERAVREVIGKFNWRRFVISSTISSIPFGLFFGMLAGIPNVFNNMTEGLLIRLFLFNMAMLICAQIVWLSWQTDPKKESRLLNRSHAAPFYLSSLLMIVMSYALWFSARIYPLIPFSLGGGRPLTIAFIEGEKRMPDEIERPNPSAKRSIPYKLLLSTDRYYVVVSPSPKERSIEISRDSLAGMVVLTAD